MNKNKKIIKIEKLYKEINEQINNKKIFSIV